MPPAVSGVERNWTQPSLVILSALISMFGTFLQLRFQSAATSPFDTHRLHISAFFSLIVICAVSLGIKINLEAAGSGCPAIVSTIFLLSLSLALILLLLIIEPYVGWPVLIVWFLCFVKLTCESYEQIRDSIVSAVLYVWFVYFVKLTCESYEQIRDSIVSAAKRASDFLKTLFNCNRNQNGEANQATTDNV